MANHNAAARIAHFLHQKFLWFLAISYLIASILPGPGVWLREVSFGHVALFGGSIHVSLSMLMLSFLLFNAGLGVEAAQLKKLNRSPVAVLSGLLANLVIPIGFIFCVTQIMRLWHNPDEVQNILVGLALVASMPIAGSSTAWSQNANGNMALSLAIPLPVLPDLHRNREEEPVAPLPDNCTMQPT